MVCRSAIFTILFVLGAAAPVVAQPRNSDALEALTDVLGLTQTVRGYVVQHREATLVLRGEDGRTYTINTAGLDVPAMGRLKEGRLVTVAVKSARPGAMPIASAVEAIEIQPSASVAGTAHERVHGFVEAVGLGSLTLKTTEGHVLSVDTTQVTEPVRARPGDLVTIDGKMLAGHSERFVAETIRSENVSEPAASPPAGR